MNHEKMRRCDVSLLLKSIILSHWALVMQICELLWQQNLHKKSLGNETKTASEKMLQRYERNLKNKCVGSDERNSWEKKC